MKTPKTLSVASVGRRRNTVFLRTYTNALSSLPFYGRSTACLPIKLFSQATWLNPTYLTSLPRSGPEMIVQGILHLTQPRPTCLLPLSAPRTRLEIGKSLSNPTVTSQVSIRYSILDFAFTSLSWPSISLLPSFRPSSSSSFGPKCCCAFPHPDCWVPVTRRRVSQKLR